MARAGRPKFKPTTAQRDSVMRLRADGWAKDRIARLLKVDPDTLDKHFAEELEHGADIKLAEALQAADRGVRKGNSALIKWVTERRIAARAKQQLDARAGEASEPPMQARPEKLGKKEERLRAASNVSGKFAPPLPPKLH